MKRNVTRSRWWPPWCCWAPAATWRYPEEQRQGQRSGFRLVGHGPEALAIRVHASAQADRSIDVQTYIWHADLTGLYLANELLLAADRGVRVRLLLDDLDARNNNYGLAALDAHPNIAVRLFNPAACNGTTVRRPGTKNPKPAWGDGS